MVVLDMKILGHVSSRNCYSTVGLKIPGMVILGLVDSRFGFSRFGRSRNVLKDWCRHRHCNRPLPRDSTLSAWQRTSYPTTDFANKTSLHIKPGT
jgi:hypothetical protein